ncbi:MAG: four-carbon acid sugar kinase family protein [Caldisphaera sp.]
MNFFVISDDFTGANGVASMMSNYCKAETLNIKDLFFDPRRLDSFQCIALNTNTRNSTPQQAKSIISAISKQINDLGGIFAKRIDSTLRGNIEAELLALGRDKKFLITDTIPEYNRFTKNGNTFSPHKILNIAGIFNELRGNHYSITQINKFEKNLDFFVLDSATYDDLEQLSHIALDNNLIPVDPGPLCSIYGKNLLNLPKNQKKEVKPVDRVIYIIGTIEPITLAQIEYSKNHGFTVFTLENYYQVDKINNNIILFDYLKESTKIDEKFIKYLSNYDALVISGGDTANLIFNRANGIFVENMPDILPLIGIGKIGGGALNNKIIVSKGGKIGTQDIFIKINSFLLNGEQVW